MSDPVIKQARRGIREALDRSVQIGLPTVRISANHLERLCQMAELYCAIDNNERVQQLIKEKERLRRIARWYNDNSPVHPFPEDIAEPHIGSPGPDYDPNWRD